MHSLSLCKVFEDHSLSLIFFLMWDPSRSQAQKLWGLWCLSKDRFIYTKPDLGCTIRTLCMCNSSEVVITETHFHPQMEHQRWVSPQFLHPSLSCDWMHVWEWQMARRWCQPFLAVTIYNIRHCSCLSCTGYGAGRWSILKHEHPSC